MAHRVLSDQCLKYAVWNPSLLCVGSLPVVVAIITIVRYLVHGLETTIKLARYSKLVHLRQHLVTAVGILHATLPATTNGTALQPQSATSEESTTGILKSVAEPTTQAVARIINCTEEYELWKVAWRKNGHFMPRKQSQTVEAACADPWPKNHDCTKPYMTPFYRLGDAFRLTLSLNVAEYHTFYFPHSLAARCIQTRSRWNKKPCWRDKPFQKRLQESINSSGDGIIDVEKPAANDLVIHLRSGDVVELCGRDFWDGNGCEPDAKGYEAYLRPRQYFENMSAKARAAKFSKAYIITGWHFEYSRALMAGSMQYVRRVAAIFRRHKIATRFRINYNADCDFAFMVNAKHFIGTGGNYDAMIAKLVILNGGEVFAQ